ncbi:MAG: hypothetical protein HKM24_02950 [Gammaproteobacteria bacterium]|nr:hypothetical protein [Gammaproteobacteria bacterium]
MSQSVPQFFKKHFSFMFPLPLWLRLAGGRVFNRSTVRNYKDRRLFFDKALKALSFNGISGDYVEFGCHGGMTFKLAHQSSRRQGQSIKLWGFDSFSGLPDTEHEEDEHPFWQPGTLATSVDDFHRVCKRNGIPRDDYKIVEGYYENSLPKFAPNDEPNDICLAYIDCDLYSSTKAALDFLRPRLKHGMIIAFDDYFCWSKTHASGERMAMLEEFSDNDRWSMLPYLNFGWHGMSFIVESKQVG